MRKYDYKKITTPEKAYAVHPDAIDLAKITKALKSLPARLRRGMLATLNAQVITEVINNNDPKVPVFDPNYNDSKNKWGPWCLGGDSSGAGFRFDDDDWSGTISGASGGARLALRDQPRLQHMKKYFPHIYKEYFLMLK